MTAVIISSATEVTAIQLIVNLDNFISKLQTNTVQKNSVYVAVYVIVLLGEWCLCVCVCAADFSARQLLNFCKINLIAWVAT